MNVAGRTLTLQPSWTTADDRVTLIRRPRQWVINASSPADVALLTAAGIYNNGQLTDEILLKDVILMLSDIIGCTTSLYRGDRVMYRVNNTSVIVYRSRTTNRWGIASWYNIYASRSILYGTEKHRLSQCITKYAPQETFRTARALVAWLEWAEQTDRPWLPSGIPLYVRSFPRLMRSRNFPTHQYPLYFAAGALDVFIN